MKKYVLCIWSLLVALSGSTQNLVPNPSFEDTVMCPDAGAQVAYAKHWYIAEQTPDYFNECCVYPQFSIPSNTFDYQYAATGYAYCGFCAYSTVDTFYREKIGIQLSSSLVLGNKYYVSFKLSATSRYLNGASNRIGALFSTVHYTPANPSQSNNFCHMWTDSIIADTVNWVHVFGSFIADSAYTYLTIGNFFTNAHTDTFRFWQLNALQSYYFIDDVCVSEDSALCIGNPLAVSILQGRKRELTAYPNPANNHLSIITETETDGFIELYTSEGEVLLKQKIPRGHFEAIEDVSHLTNGIYFLKVTTGNKTISQKIIIHH